MRYPRVVFGFAACLVLVGALVSSATHFVIVPIVAFFFLSEGRSIKRATIELIPNRYFEMVLSGTSEL